MRPMLSATIENLATVKLPVLASPKLDGIRATVVNGVLTSRNGKPIPNKATQATFGVRHLEGLDGELIMGPPTDPACFRKTTSAVMSHNGQPDVNFWVFDLVHPSLIFVDRLRLMTDIASRHPQIIVVPQYAMEEQAQITAYEEQCLEAGFEGLMLRDPSGKYKFGRSTMIEQGLMKLKRFHDSEAVVIGVEERMSNQNELKTDALGYAERSSHRENMVGLGDLGAFLVRDIRSGVEFSIGTGVDLTLPLRAELWANKPIGRIVKYKYFPSGSKDKPRFPVFIGFRDERDM